MVAVVAPGSTSHPRVGFLSAISSSSDSFCSIDAANLVLVNVDAVCSINAASYGVQ